MRRGAARAVGQRCAALLCWLQGILALLGEVWLRGGDNGQLTSLVGIRQGLGRLLHLDGCRQARRAGDLGGRQRLQLHLRVVAEEGVVLHSFRGRLQHGAQGLLQAERGRLLLLGWRRWLLLLLARQWHLACPWVGALGYLHLVEIGLQLGLLLQEEPLLMQPESRTRTIIFALWSVKALARVLHASHSNSSSREIPGQPCLFMEIYSGDLKSWVSVATKRSKASFPHTPFLLPVKLYEAPWFSPFNKGRISNTMITQLPLTNSCDMTKGRSPTSQFPKHAEIRNQVLPHADTIHKRNLFFLSLFLCADLLFLQDYTQLLWVLSIFSVKVLIRINQLSGVAVNQRVILDYSQVFSLLVL